MSGASIKISCFTVWTIAAMLVSAMHATSLPVTETDLRRSAGAMLRSELTESGAIAAEVRWKGSLEPNPGSRLDFTRVNLALLQTGSTQNQSSFRLPTLKSSSGEKTGDRTSEIAEIPEPASLLLVGSGLVGIATLLRKMRLI